MHTKKIRCQNPLVSAALILGLTFAFSCEQKSSNPVDPYDYLPLETGHYLIYEVKEEVYSSGQKDAVYRTWQEKDEIERVATKEDGTKIYIFSRSTRNAATDYWQKIKEFSVEKFPDKILTNLDNQTVLSLVFPYDSKIRWNGNSYNIQDAQDYHYENINQPVTIGMLPFPNTLTVVERKDTSIINRYVGIKQYGLGVGLISDDQTAFEYCQDENCIGSGEIESGYHRSRQIFEFGKR